MGRYPQGPASGGSQHWLQILVNKRPPSACVVGLATGSGPPVFFPDRPRLLEGSLLAALGKPKCPAIEWLSPLHSDAYAEYRDQAFLDRLGAVCDSPPLSAFWPSGGPVWDGLARTAQDDLLLVEAKAHIPEMRSTGCRACPSSRARIEQSLTATQRFLKAATPMAWEGPFYQYTNRLAHLYLLRHLNGLSAYLVHLYFVNDRAMKGPTTGEEWLGALKLRKSLLSLDHHVLAASMVDVFIDMDRLGP